MRVEVDRSKCVGLGNCEAASPMYFEVGDDAQVIVLRDDIAEEDLPEVDEAVRACPVNALRLVG